MRYILRICKETAVILYRSFIKGFYPGTGGKRGTGFVKTDVAVSSDADDLEVQTPGFFNFVLVPLAEFFRVLCLAVRNVDILPGNVDMFEQVLKHEIVIALVVVRFQPQ